jgi:ferredoxin
VHAGEDSVDDKLIGAELHRPKASSSASLLARGIPAASDDLLRHAEPGADRGEPLAPSRKLGHAEGCAAPTRDRAAHASSSSAASRIRDLERCIGCGVCAGACHKDAIAMRRGSTPRKVPANSSRRRCGWRSSGTGSPTCSSTRAPGWAAASCTEPSRRSSRCHRRRRSSRRSGCDPGSSTRRCGGFGNSLRARVALLHAAAPQFGIHSGDAVARRAMLVRSVPRWVVVGVRGLACCRNLLVHGAPHAQTVAPIRRRTATKSQVQIAGPHLPSQIPAPEPLPLFLPRLRGATFRPARE